MTRVSSLSKPPWDLSEALGFAEYILKPTALTHYLPGRGGGEEDKFHLKSTAGNLWIALCA